MGIKRVPQSAWNDIGKILQEGGETEFQEGFQDEHLVRCSPVVRTFPCRNRIPHLRLGLVPIGLPDPVLHNGFHHPSDDIPEGRL